MKTLKMFAAKLGRLSSALAAAASAALYAAADAAAQEARRNAPVDSGELRAGIGIDIAGKDAYILRSSAPHAALVEYGSSRSPAQPYMQPAAELARDALAAAAMDEARRALRDALG